MSEKMKISDYKGFELWDTPAPEGWRVHQYPVQVTCNGKHVNAFANAHEAMSVIDGMDADTIAYHMRRAPTTEPTAAAQGEDTPELYQPKADLNADNLEYWPKMFRERVEWKDYYNEHAKNDMMDALDVIATLQAALQQAQRERDAALAALRQIIGVWKLMVEGEMIGRGMSETTVIVRMVDIANAALAASALQAAQPADGEG